MGIEGEEFLFLFLFLYIFVFAVEILLCFGGADKDCV